MNATPLDRKLLAIVAADVVGYSKVMEADEAGTIARLRALRAEVLDPAIAKHRGRVVKLMGDGSLLAFQSVVDATACSAEIQALLATRNAGVPEDHRMALRIGINLGDVALIDGDIYGDGVNVAARLEQLAEPGGVIVSGSAYDQLQGKFEIPLDFVGELQVKNISRPIRAYRLRLAGKARPFVRVHPPHRGALMVATACVLLLASGGVSWFLWPEQKTEKPSIAVLPFENNGSDEATARLAGGLTQDIITDLSRTTDFDVIARGSTEVYKGKPLDVRQIGRDLDVRYVLGGSVQREGDRLRATAQLMDATTGANIWSDRWDRPAGDFFELQTEISDRVFSQFEMAKGPIKGKVITAARRKMPQSLTAYELTLLGVEKQLSPTRESIAESIKILDMAVAADPDYAPAWANLASAHVMAANFGADREQSSRAAMAAAERAVVVDPNDADAHAALGEILANKGDFERARSELETALRLMPGSFAILVAYLSWASAFGEPALGAELADRAVRLNPHFQPWASGGLRYAYFMAGRYEDALKVMERQMPENYSKYAWVERAGSLAALGRSVEARQTVADALLFYPELTIELIANDPAFNATEQERHVETMRLAGFPACAKPGQLNEFRKPRRLAECAGGTLQP